ncbi:hypothetical protein CEXT_679071 [Caerostris extrusa]|uniref:Uncharacterized protein n=1 Tax=Caerostris extrusa TaxID=172846 RepID=A0AAV4SQW4_CAEEX|nr:hypothetical protein CEXT_679071 [Caerostris extrusa]
MCIFAQPSLEPERDPFNPGAFCILFPENNENLFPREALSAQQVFIFSKDFVLKCTSKIKCFLVPNRFSSRGLTSERCFKSGTRFCRAMIEGAAVGAPEPGGTRALGKHKSPDYDCSQKN